MSPSEAPSALTTSCPDCGEETLHAVLRGRSGASGDHITIDATVECTECGRVHHALVREAKPLELAVVVSDGGASTRAKVEVPADEELAVGDALIVDDHDCIITGLEAKDLRRVDAAAVRDIQTVWAKRFEEIGVRFAINLDRKTITKAIPASPETEFTVGEEHLFGRLRVTVHAIKTKERMMKRGTATAGEIVRIFAKPTPLGDKTHRPDKRSREQLRAREERDARGPR